MSRGGAAFTVALLESARPAGPGQHREGGALLAPLSAFSYHSQLAHEELGRDWRDSSSIDQRRGGGTAERTPGIQRASSSTSSACATRSAGWRTTHHSTTAAYRRRRGRPPQRLVRARVDTAEPPPRCTISRCATSLPRGGQRLLALDLDEAWVYRLVRQESRFVADARSSAGAQGSCSSCRARHARSRAASGCQVPAPQVISVDTNINLGTYHLRRCSTTWTTRRCWPPPAQRGTAASREWRAAAEARCTSVHPIHGNPRLCAQSDEQHDVHSRLFGQPYVSLRRRLGTIGPRPADNSDRPAPVDRRC